jgi:hypothetical protein
VQLAPGGEYLYYETVAGEGGSWNGRPRVQRRFVVDVRSRSAGVWEITEPVASAYWHPNGRELYLRLQETPAEGKQPVPARFAVARFP